MKKSLSVLLIGHGKMGKAIEQLLIDRGHKVAAIIELGGLNKLSDSILAKVDVAIEFTEPSQAFDNIYFCVQKGIPVITGTTGWLSRKHELEPIVAEYKGAVLQSTNFSVGVNLFFAVNAALAEMMNRNANYEVEVFEEHHTEKKDAPSGTALTLGQIIIDQLDRLDSWQIDRKDIESQLPIKVSRVAGVPGTHVVTYTSTDDTIELKHTAHSRFGFANGAIDAAEWIIGKQGIFGLKDMLGF